jgi:DCN1-like protein 1/2
MRYLADLGINMETAEFLVPLEIVQAPALGEITRDGFIDGWMNIAGYGILSRRAKLSANARIAGLRPTQ